MTARIWFNTRVLCCEESPELATRLVAAKARVTWAPLAAPVEGPWRLRTGDWANPDYPFALVEGNELVLLRWPQEARPAEEVRWLLTGFMHLCVSARRSKVRALGFQFPETADPLLLHSGRFLAEYVGQAGIPGFVCQAGLVELLEAEFAAGQSR
ncbi:hypothetical protein JST97_26380 [bacterium]|nr:hypothetical protein [bacterium]